MSLDPVRRAVLTDMAYELGGSGLAGFPRLLDAMRRRWWATSAVELKNSLLFSQVPTREQSNIACLTTGEWPAGVTCTEDLIKRHEGCVFVALPDAKGKYEIGYGHDITAPQGGVSVTCTQAEADAWFAADFALAVARAMADLGADYW